MNELDYGQAADLMRDAKSGHKVVTAFVREAEDASEDDNHRDAAHYWRAAFDAVRLETGHLYDVIRVMYQEMATVKSERAELMEFKLSHEQIHSMYVQALEERTDTVNDGSI